MIDGLPFDSIENVLYYKHKESREKDLKDILLIEQWMRMQKSQEGPMSLSGMWGKKDECTIL
jgi:hypothetical protein